MGARSANKPWLYRFLDGVERPGNRLPHPATLFALFAISVVLASGVFAQFVYTAVDPSTGEVVHPVSLLSGAGLRRMVTSLVSNFTSFVPLGTVLVAMLGVGVAERSGLLGAALRALVITAPRRLVTLVVVFSGVLSNAACEAGYVILGPLAGMAAAFAGVSGGYSANLVLGTVDPLLAGISTEMARIVDPRYEVNPAANYYFMAASTLLVTAVCAVVTEKVVEPRLGGYSGETVSVEHPSSLEKRGLWAAAAAFAAFAILVILSVAQPDGVLRNPESGGVLDSPFLSGIVTILFLMFLIPGLAYGLATGSIRKDSDIIEAMGKTMSTLGVYIVLVFFAAQFVAFFGWTHLGIITAIKGAALLKSVGLTGIPSMVAFVAVAAFMNLFMGSASAKWAILAPVFVPMFMLLGYTPELTQAAYRIGDSATNVVTPMMSYFALIVAFAQKYDKSAGIGTIIAMMLPYTAALLASWTLFLVLWMLAG
ncbi:MAG: AbgT family transporter [Bryobacteraceae bacterium]